MIEYSVPLLVALLGSYIGARFAFLAGWTPVVGMLRLIALWGAVAWIGYSTPIYMLIASLPLGILWSRTTGKILFTLIFELLFTAFLVWHSSVEPVWAYLAGLVIFDQSAVRLLLSRFDRQREVNKNLHRLLVLGGSLAVVVLVYHYYRPPIISYANSHSVVQILNLQPEGPAALWYFKRDLKANVAGDAQAGSVYWEARFPTSQSHCALSFHGAHSAGSLQSTARTLGRGVQLADLRLFAVDHPGFGASPAPASGAAPEVWDPAHLTSAVLRQMSVAGCEDIVVIGHSQGVTEALRVLTANTPRVSRAYAFGAGLYTINDEQDDYWFDRFHIDRGLSSANRVERANWKLIRDLYYLNQMYCSTTKAGKNYSDFKPFYFVEFEREHPNLVETRETLRSCLDYPESETVTLPTNHYLDSLQVGDMLFFQRSSPRVLSDLFPKAPLTDTSSDTAEQQL